MSSDIHKSRGVSWKAALLVVATAIAYLPALKSGFVWDDDSMLTGNGLIKAADGLYRFWFTLEPTDYWPVTSSTLWVEWRLWGMHALGYHATNLALHISESLLLWVILRRLRIPGAWLAAVIFALHPVNVESVAWIAQRKNLMAMLFFLLSIFWFLKTDPVSAPDPVRLYRPGAGRWYWLSLLALALGMLSKGSVAMLPVVLLGLIAWHRKLAIRDLIFAAPFFVVAAIFAGVDVWFTNHGMAVSIRNAGFVERLLGAAAAVWFYLYKALVPLNLIFVYPQWHIEVSSLSWWAPLLAAAAATAVVWHYRTSWSRPALFAWGYFCVMLAPALGFTDVCFMKYSLVADHYQHLAIIAPIVLASASLDFALGRFQRHARSLVQVLVVLIVGSLGILTWQQCRTYRDLETLYRTTLERNPGCWLAHDNLGVALEKSPGRLPEAIAHYEAALKIKPDDAIAHTGLGNAFADTPGRLNDAEAQYEAALKIDPDYPDAHYDLGNLLGNIPGRSDDAIAQFEAALKLRPGYVDAHCNLGVLFAKTPGRLTDAIAHFKIALRIDPSLVEVHNNLGIALARENRLQEAMAQFESALYIDPDDAAAHRNLGYALQLAGHPEEAKVHLEAAERLQK